MTLQENIRVLLYENVNDQIKSLILNPKDYDSINPLLDALRLKYGEIVPLYHATSLENSKIIDKDGLRLVYGKNYKSFSKEEILYFQVGISDYRDDYRSVIYRLDAPIDWIGTYAYADMDNVMISDDDLIKYGINNVDDMCSELRDVICYFIWNKMSIDGMELLIADRNQDGNIFKGLKLTKIKKAH